MILNSAIKHVSIQRRCWSKSKAESVTHVAVDCQSYKTSQTSLYLRLDERTLSSSFETRQLVLLPGSLTSGDDPVPFCFCSKILLSVCERLAIFAPDTCVYWNRWFGKEKDASLVVLREAVADVLGYGRIGTV